MLALEEMEEKKMCDPSEIGAGMESEREREGIH